MHQEQGIYMELLNVSLTPAFLSQLLTARLPCEREEEAAQAGFKSEVWKWQQWQQTEASALFPKRS